MRSPWLHVLLAFAIGAGVGFFASTRSFEGRPHGGTERLVQKFARELRLDDAQTAHVRSVLESKRAQVRALREETRPRYEALRAASKAEIAKVLTPDQLARFEELEAEWRVRREARRARLRG